MAHPHVVQVVEARIRDGFTRCRVVSENAFIETPGDATAWLLVDFPWCREEWIEADGFLEEGSARAFLSVPAGEGAHAGRAWLEEIAALFRGQAIDGVQFFAPRPGTSDDRNDRGAFFGLALMIPYSTIIPG